MTGDGGNGSRKELARKLRRQAYQRAKARRDADPAYLAMKEAAKRRRKETYQRIKAAKKASSEEEKSREKHAREELRREERTAADAALLALVRLASSGSSLPN